MSVRVMSQVWDLKLPHADKFVLLAMADHADHDGNNVYPSVRTIAIKTGYSERQVQRIITSLEESKLLIQVQTGQGAATIYRIETSAAEKVETRRKPARSTLAPVPVETVNKSDEITTKCHPCQNVTPDIYDIKNGQNVTTGGDIYDSSSYSLYEPSIEPSFEPSGRIAPVSAEKPKSAASSVSQTSTVKVVSEQSKPDAKASSAYPPDMMAFWECYPTEGRTRGSLKELQSDWQKLSAGQKGDAQRGLHAALQTAQFREYPKAPHRWIKGRCWEVFLGDLSPIPALVLTAPAETSAFAAGSAERAARFSAIRQKSDREGKRL